MAKTDNQVNYVVTAQDAGASGAFMRVGRSVDSVNMKLKGLKQSFGEESALGGIGKIFAGSGAVMGIALIERRLADAAEGVEKFWTEYEKGSRTALEITNELISKLPVLGDMQRSTDSVLRLGFRAITGDAPPEQIKGLADDITKRQKAAADAADKRATDAERQAALGRLTGTARDRQAESFRFGDSIAAISAQRAGRAGAGLDFGREFAALDRQEKAERDKHAQELKKILAKDIEAAKGGLSTLVNGFKGMADAVIKRSGQNAAAEALRKQFAREDRYDELGAEADSIRESMRRAAMTPHGRTAAAFSDTGASALLSANQSRNDDPAVKELRVQTTKLKSIDDEIKKMRQDDKQRSRTEQTQEIFN
jgi:hypothetical protein